MKKYFLAILLTVLTTFAFSSRVGAVSDVTYTITAPDADVYICDNNLTNVQVKCSDYRYIKWFVTGVNATAVQFSIAGNNLRLPATSGTFEISGRNPIAVTKSLFPTGATVNVILTDTNCVEPEPCPEPLPPDRSAIMDDFHNVFLKVIVGVIPISAIIFVVWFMIDMLSSLIFGRGK